mmetsp:Transcript_16338/g.49078  ORF Transcript_16338/g.49078 Transcript_16338/m.49078 type:complete len:291 (+) Transcript_16338:77-949(+)|eukprot:CAMPEP_0174239440 /NCGR_PEP_ID=MMETSP0417-20130205/14672_1 /TAXON_ID=242541 /ORGANISM="Mayorella sp, Strain BSH-02190019" /LENGTH=290 /DNA_ID=CAMNT_0015318381 /DNA_START=20 /DNA_END=892 /DNA_ORIENTATION=+
MAFLGPLFRQLAVPPRWKAGRLPKFSQGTILPWGLLERQEVDSTVRQDMEARRGTMHGLFPTEEDKQWAHDEVDRWTQASAAAVYRRLGELFCTQPNRTVQWAEENIVTPSMSALLDEVRAQYATVGLRPVLSVQHVSATLVDLRLEHGAADHFGKVFGLWSSDEIRHHLFAGLVGPEFSGKSSKNPYLHRFVADVCFDVIEEFSVLDAASQPSRTDASPVESAADHFSLATSSPSPASSQSQESNLSQQSAPSTPPMCARKHYWTFTRPGVLDDDSPWLVSNINEALTS